MRTDSSGTTASTSGFHTLADVFETLAIGIGVFDPDLHLITFNQLFQSTRDYPEDLCQTGVSFRDLLDYDHSRNQLFYDGSSNPVDAWIRRAENRNRYTSEDILEDGRSITMTLAPIGEHRSVLTFVDITEQTRNERALRSSQEWHDLVSEASSEGIYDWNIRTNELKVSYRLTAMLGLSPGDLTSKAWNDRIHPDDFVSYRDALIGHFKGETPTLRCDYRIRRKSGDYIWFSDNGKCVREGEGRAIRLVGAVADVTTQKLAEASLYRSEERYTLAMQAINEGVYDWDIDADEIYYSAGVRSALGLDANQLKSANDWFDRIHSDDQSKWRDALVDHLKGRTDRFLCDFRYLAGDGRWRWARQHGIAQFNEEGRAIRVVGASGDITELMEQRAAAKEARDQLAKAIETISDGFAIYNAEDRLVLCNDQYRAIYPGLDDVLIPGTSYETILRALAERRILADIDDDMESWVRNRLDIRNRAAAPYHTPLSDGRWANVSWRRTRDGGLVGVFTDITSLKTAEIKLRESEERYALAMQSANEGLWDWDVASGTMFIAPRLAHDLGLTPDLEGRVSTEFWQTRIHPEDLGAFRDAIKSHLLGETTFYSCEFRVLDANNKYIWHYHRGVGQRAESGRVFRMTGSTTDITSRKLTEKNLQSSEERYALATEAATEGLYDWNVAADQLIVSQRLNEIMSLPLGSLTSSEWNSRVHLRDREKYRAAMLAHFQGDAPYLSCEYRIKCGDGEYRWIRDNATSVRDDSGRVLRLVGAISDITERKNAELALVEAKQRLEAANQIAIEKAHALESLSTKLSKYLSPQVYSSIFTGEQSVEINPKRKKLTILFSDIAGFTTIVDTLESEEITEMLNEYLTEMSKIALEFGGTIDKFIGDAILLFFGDPETKGPREDAIACVKMAIAMQRRLRNLQTKWRSLGIEQAFELRIGITTGFCTVGNFGSEDRMDYTVVGNEVNAAARLQAHAETGGILLSSETYALVKDDVVAEDQGLVSLKGISRPARAYKVVGIYDELVEAGKIIKVERPGVSLVVNPSNLDSETRSDLLAALENAARKIQDS